MELLSLWEAFYVIAGPAAAVLIGLQFVVIVLNTEQNSPANNMAVNAFATPTIVHFCAVLLISGIMTAPWPSITGVAFSLGFGGAIGMLYAAMIIRRVRQQGTGYTPVLEDWIWHCILPVISYGMLLVAAFLLQSAEEVSLFLIGAVSMLLQFIGIHNAWDAVVFSSLRRVNAVEQNSEQQ